MKKVYVTVTKECVGVCELDEQVKIFPQLQLSAVMMLVDMNVIHSYCYALVDLLFFLQYSSRH